MDYSHWEKVVDGKVGNDIADIIYNQNQVKNTVSRLTGQPVCVIGMANNPSTVFADVKGIKIRTQTSGVVSQYWKEIGAVPTSVAWAELLSSVIQQRC